MPGSGLASYWDACLFLSYIEGDPDRATDLESLLDQAEKGERRIATSVISITEVAYAKQEKDQRTLESEAEQRIDALWAAGSPVTMIEMHPRLAREARSLMRRSMETGRRLSPLDAIHLASAAQLGVDEFLTYDEKLIGMRDLVAFPIRRPLVEQHSLPLDSPRSPSAE